MPKIVLMTLILPLLLAPIGPILAQEVASGTETVKDTFELPKTPLDNFFYNWFSSGNIRNEAQKTMNQAQVKLEETTGQALDTAKEAAKDEISQQADKAIKEARQKAETYVGGVVAAVKTAINDLITKIKSFFTDLFKKEAKTY